MHERLEQLDDELFHLNEAIEVSQPMISQLERGTKVCTLPLAAA